MRMLTKLGLVVLSVVFCASLGQAAPILSLNFRQGGTGLASDDEAGVVPAANWAEAPGYPNFTDVVLKDQNGNATTALASSANFTGNADSAVVVETTDPNSKMFARGKRGNVLTGNPAVELMVTGLPADFQTNGYDAYLYFATNGLAGEDDDTGMSFTLGGTTYYALNDGAAANYSGAFVPVTSTESESPTEGANYVKFSGLTDASFTLTQFNDPTNQQAALLTGMQIVQVPEPATMGLLGLGGLVALRRRRR